MTHSYEELVGVVKTLAARLWDQRVSQSVLQAWLGNFDDESERDLAIHLLAHFSYFGEREMRQLLRSLYRDLVRYPIVQGVRKAHGGTYDPRVVEPAVCRDLRKTRFIGVGNPSESGHHLLYYFRQENDLPKNVFINTHEIFRSVPVAPNTNNAGPGRSRAVRDPDVHRYIFIDDVCGSGTQAVQYSTDIVEELVALKPDAYVAYFCLFALQEGLEHVRANTKFTEVRALFTLDESFRSLGESSRYYLPDEADDRARAHAAMSKYGAAIWPEHPLGYKGAQLLFGFFHNVPDNTLPVFWMRRGWHPIFGRYPKIEWSTP